MAGYSPLKITGMSTGLVQSRENFLLPDDAYPVLQNAYVWRERILRKQGCQLLGRLRRNLVTQSLGNTIATGVQFNLFTQINLSGSITGITQANPGEVTTSTNHLLQNNQYVTLSGVGGMTQVNGKTYKITVTAANKFTIGVDTTAFTAYTSGGTWQTNNLSSQPLKTITPGTVIITMPGPIVFTDQGNGTLTSPTPGNSGTINYATGNITLTTTAGAGTSLVTFSYYPGLPVMGISIRELNNSTNDQTIFFDQVYAYIFNATTNAFEEFIPGTTWNASGQNNTATNFFWSTNYFTASAATPFAANNNKLFWVTNNTGFAGATADPPRITNGVTWVDFFPSAWSNIDSTNFLTNWLAMLPFRGRMVTFNTWEGPTAASSLQYRQRIRWSRIGNPFIAYHNTTGPNDPSTGSWRSDIRGQGGFLDIPTNEDIVSVGFVRDNLVIYCERSTWQLRYTGRSIAPFQIEKVNSELGAEGTFSSIQFDTSLLGIGDKGIVECDSYKSERIDVKIPDFVFNILDIGNGTSRTDGQRVNGIRDFVKKLAYWTIPLVGVYPPQYNGVFPNQRLVYNYENDSWALFNDSFTFLGTYQAQNNRTWLNTPLTWLESDFSWINEPTGFPQIVGGNQQGFVEILDQINFNDVSLAIYDVSSADPSVLYVPSHNLDQFSVISISGIPNGSPYSSLNGGVFQVVIIDNDHFSLKTYNSSSLQFSDPVTATPSGVFQGIGNIAVRDNFSIKSKKFNFLDEGQNIQLGYLDILMAATGNANPGAITLNVYLDYNDSTTSNTLPENDISDGFGPANPDTFFNATIPTTAGVSNSIGGTKFWQRVYCPSRSNFLTLEYTFSNEQMSNNVFKTEVQIDAQVLWIRRAGRMTQN